MKSYIGHSLITLAIVFFLCFAGGSLYAAQEKGSVRFAENRLSVAADKMPLTELLKEISESASINIYVSKDLQPVNVTVNLSDSPLEDALKVILRGYNYAGIYQKNGESWQITAVKVYPTGQPGGTLLRLGDQGSKVISKDPRAVTKTVIVSSGMDVITYGGIEGNEGILVPSMTVPNPSVGPTDSLNQPWFALQKQLEKKEFEEYQKLKLMHKKVAEADDPEKQETLAIMYADEARKFYDMKQSHLNKIEAMKRISESRELTGE